MRFPISLLGLLCLPAAGAFRAPYFTVLAEPAEAWPAILESVGFQPRTAAEAHILVFGAGAAALPQWAARVEKGDCVIVEGESSLAAMFGFERTEDGVRASRVEDVHRPGLPIVWERPLEIPRFKVPRGAVVFAKEHWSGAPLVAGYRRGAGAVLWVAVSPGEQGYERFPYLVQALAALGVPPPFHSARLWAFLDSSYRRRVDIDYFAARWRASGIAALHVAAWHFFEPDRDADAWLARLIAACHERGILVYAWLELPHVSERFWNEHPEWREKTALLQDAQLDWRKLMNLQNRDCFQAVARGVRDLAGRFDWDGINLAELYFESLQGTGNPSRFTPMNPDFRRSFRETAGFDPIEIFAGRRGAGSLRSVLEFRAGVAARMQQEWIQELGRLRQGRPDLDLVLTHIDDRFDTSMRDALGADAARLLAATEDSAATFLIEDPATVWHLGPQRYAEIAKRYEPLTPRRERLAVDINIVDRYQDVYPTRQQTGGELFQLVHTASKAFDRVALYSEKSILPPDVAVLPAAAATVNRVERIGPKLLVDSSHAVAVPWHGGVLVDGAKWPVRSDSLVWLPAGAHAIEPGAPAMGPRVLDFNGDLESARYSGPSGIDLAYRARSRALAVLDRPPVRVEIDGIESRPALAGPVTVILPRGQHLVTVTTQ